MKIRTIIILFFINVIVVSKVNSQSLPFTYDYHFNSYLINPAEAGHNVKGISFRLIDRQQWLSLPGSPQTGSFSFTNLIKKTNGIGVMLARDAVGLQQRLMGKVSYSHHSLIDKHNNRHISFGLAAEMYQYSMTSDFTDAVAKGDGTLTRAAFSKIYPNASAGALFYGDKGYFGLSVFNLIKPELTTDLEPMIIYVSLGRKEQMGKNMFLELNYLAKINSDFNFEMDVNAYLSFGSKFWIGTSYRTPASVLAMLGFNFGRYSLGYSFEYSLSSIMSSSYGTHSLMLAYNILKGKKNKFEQIECPAYY